MDIKRQIIFLTQILSIVVCQSGGIFALLPIEVSGLEESNIISITELTQSSLLELANEKFIERNQIEKVLNEKSLNQSGITEIAHEVGSVLSVDYLVYGVLSKLGETSYLTLKIVDSHSGEILYSEKNSGDYKIDNYYNLLIRPTVKELFSFGLKTRDLTIIIKSVSGIDEDKYSESDCWVQLLINKKVVGRTRLIKNSNHPIFNESFRLSNNSNDELLFKIFDKDYSRNHLLGEVRIDSLYSGMYPFEVQNEQVITVTFLKKDKTEEKIMIDNAPENFDGQLELEFH